jgi:hypothetical protein
MGDEKIKAHSTAVDIRPQAACSDGRLSLMIVNYDPTESRDVLVTINFANLKPGIRKLSARRIDENRRWSSEKLELDPIDERRVAVLPEFIYQFYSPADSVLLVTLEESQ